MCGWVSASARSTIRVFVSAMNGPLATVNRARTAREWSGLFAGQSSGFPRMSLSRALATRRRFASPLSPSEKKENLIARLLTLPAG